jgi:hypothetical protein
MATCGGALAQVPQGRLYVFHSAAQGGCPALDWHVTAGANGALSGMISWNNMESMAHASGTVKNGQVQMTATEVGGQNRTATVTGTVRQDGWLTVNVTGPNVSCQGINIPFYTPPASAGRG